MTESSKTNAPASSPALPLPLRVANKLGNWAGAARPQMGQLQVHDLLLEARRQAALDDFGDGQFREGLNQLVASLNDEANLSPVGVKILKSQLVAVLATRLRVRDYAKKHDYLEYEQVTAPIIVCGLPRTGTTLLSNLLDLDPMNRSVLQWEAASIAPPPTLSGRAVDPRLMSAAKEHGGFNKLAPHLQAMHPTDPHLPTECVSLFGPSFQSLMFETLAWIPSYGSWLESSDMVGTYQFHKLQLQILQSTIPTERWSLKSPAHLWHLDALRMVYPDARMVWTHRDPMKVVPSVASLVTSLQAIGNENVDRPGVARGWLDKCEHAVAVGAESRSKWDATQWFDLQYAEFHEDPISGVERLYQHFGMELSDVARRSMEIWMAENPKDKHGVHHYSVETFDLQPDQIRETFSAYMEQYQIPSEV